jgi:thiol-disulfide isomerase/thioredoxin
MKLLAALLLPVFALTAQAATPAAMPSHPSLKVTTLDGQSFDLGAQRGHWVIVNFWATWCVPCIKEMPDISRFVSTHKNVTAIGLAYEDSDKADIQTFLKKHPVSYPVAQVTMDNAPKDFDEPRGLPTSYLIGPDGSVAHRFVGPVTVASLSAAVGLKP